MNGLRELRKKAIAPVYRGCRVRVPDGAGTITQADGYHLVRGRLDVEKHCARRTGRIRTHEDGPMMIVPPQIRWSA